MRPSLRCLCVSALVAATPLCLPGAASAATIPVSCAGGSAALIAAIATANSTTQADTIDIIDGPCTITLTAAAAALGTPGSGNDIGLPIISQPLTILGHGSTIARSTVAGTPNFRILLSFTSLTLRDLTLSGGKLTGANVGAGVMALGGALTLDGVTVAFNSTVSGNGGGVWAQASTVTIDRSVIFGNSAASAGGGGLMVLGGTATIDHTQFQQNAAQNAGALYSVAATTTVHRSAFVLNSATGSTGGAIVQGGSALFKNDTFASNQGANGIGGITVGNNGTAQGIATIENSTFADNSTTAMTGAAPGGAIVTCVGAAGGACGSGTPPVVFVHNTIVTDTDSTAAPVIKPCNSDLGGIIVYDGGNIEWPTLSCVATQADPKLAALIPEGPNFNGGPTFNYRLRPNSPAIDLGTGLCPATDQRDMARPGGDGCDAGAYEAHPPQTTVTVPTGTTSAPRIRFSSDQPGSTFQCSVDGGSFSACTSPFSPAGLSEGPHTVAVRASNADPTSTNTADNTYTDPSPPTVTFTVVPAALVVTITAGPDGLTNVATQTFAFVTSAPASTIECRIDAIAAACASPYVVSALADGPHTFTVTATDAAGHAATDTRSFTVDTTAPTVSITAGPSGATIDATPTFTFTNNDPGAGTECRIDSGAFEPCPTSYTPPELADGTHTFSVQATDAAGNTGSAARMFIVDTVAPAVTITAGPSGVTNVTSASFAFANSDPDSTVECTVDASPVACANPYVASGLTDGPHTFTVTATDAAGNSGTDSRSFTVDTAAPAIDIAGPSGATRDATPTFTFTSNDPGSAAACRIDSSAFDPCSGQYTATALADGAHTFNVQARDAAGNTGSAARAFIVDTVAPAVTITAGPSGVTNVTSASFAFAYSEPGSTVECTVDGFVVACASPHVATGLSDGPHSFRVTATDAAGNSGTDARSFTVDTAGPAIDIATGPSGPTRDTRPTFTFINSDPGSAAQCRIDSAAFQPCSGQYIAPALANGAHTFSVQATDAAGNTAAAARAFVVDTIAPTVACNRPPAGPWYAADVTVLCTAGDNGSGLANANDASFTLSTSGEGAAVTIAARAIADAAGNSKVVGPFGPYKVDKTRPTIAAPAAVSVTTMLAKGAVITFADLGSATASDASSRVTVAVSGVPAGNKFPVGSTVLTYTATDAAGNQASAAQQVTVTLLTPEQAIRRLIEAINAVNSRLARKLDHALDRVLRDMDLRRPEKTCNALDNFVGDLVRANRSERRIADPSAAVLVDLAGDAKRALGCEHAEPERPSRR